jgi:hypothetical protein
MEVDEKQIIRNKIVPTSQKYHAVVPREEEYKLITLYKSYSSKIILYVSLNEPPVFSKRYKLLVDLSNRQ